MLEITKKKKKGRRKIEQRLYFWFFLYQIILASLILRNNHPRRRRHTNTHWLHVFSVMNILPSVKTQYSRIPSFYNPNGFVKSKRKTVFYGDANPVSGNNFHLNRARRLVLLRCSYSESGSITQPGLENMPLSMDLEPISGESQFDQVLTEAQQLQESVIVLWFDINFFYLVNYLPLIGFFFFHY